MGFAALALYAHHRGLYARAFQLFLELLGVVAFGKRAHAHAVHGAAILLTLAHAGFPSQHAQRAKLAMLGWEARVSEREQNGRSVYCERVGPFSNCDDAEQHKEKLDGAGVEYAMVRVQR